MKKALLVVSFGTTHLDTLEKNIAAAENTLSAAFPDRMLCRAFTSRIVRQRLADAGTQVDDVPTALCRLRESGYEDILIQPTHMICGLEWEKLLSQVQPFSFPVCKVGRPLLGAPSDYMDLAKAVLADLPERAEDTAILLMGHGTEHDADASYDTLQEAFRTLGRLDVLIGTVEGEIRIEHLIEKLADSPQIKKAICLPLMLVAGDHAKNDMSGEEPDSWASQLRRAGYAVRCIVQGMGEKAAIRQLYAAHASQAESFLFREKQKP